MLLRSTQIALSITLCLASACAGTGRNYDSPQGPRFVGGHPQNPQRNASGVDTLRVVSFNIAYARAVDSAIAVLRLDTALQRADIILLQEMDDPGTRRIARALGMQYVYYPASNRDNTKRDFGNAVLSRWPIVADEKILQPHLSRFGRTLRTATAATIDVGGEVIRVYSAHLGTMVNLSGGQRRDQLRAILADAEKYPRVVVGGDMNDPDVGKIARAAGYEWPTKNGPRTATVGRLDHIFTKGLVIPDTAAAGTVLNNRKASDHRPVWIRAIIN